MKQITLRNSTAAALVDDYHHGWLSQYVWQVQRCPSNRTSYAYRVEKNPEGRKLRVYMHREIAGLERGDPREVDHEDRNGLNNLESNLRVVTPLQNSANRPIPVANRLGYKRVRKTDNGRYTAEVNRGGMQVFLGTYDTALEAAQAFNEAALELYGEYAGLNPVPPDALSPEQLAHIRAEVRSRLTTPRRVLHKRHGPPARVYRDNLRNRWKANFYVNGRPVHIGSYHLKEEAEFAAAVALDHDAVPDPAVPLARVEFIRKRIAHLQSAHQPPATVTA